MALWNRRNRYLHVSVKDFHIVQLSESSHRLYENPPYFAFLIMFRLFLVLDDALVEIAVIHVIHDDTKNKAKIYHKLLPSKNASL